MDYENTFMTAQLRGAGEPELQWVPNVTIALAFVLFDIGVSSVFRLGLSASLFIAAMRCTGQLAVVATLLQKVFETKNPWLVCGIACGSRFVSPPKTV